MAKKRIPTAPLAELLSNANAETLRELVAKLAARPPDTLRECFEYLRKQVSLTAEQKTKSEGEIVLTLWWELLPDLQELDEYGGGEHEKEDRVADLLNEIHENLTSGEIGQEVRKELLDEVLPFIRSGNAGMDDLLYDVVYAACYSDDDLRYLAQSFEAMNLDWPIDHARGIYRKLGNREKYLDVIETISLSSQ